MFVEFAAYGTRGAATDMDGAKFFKLCKESKLLSKRFTAIDCDIIFAKVCVASGMFLHSLAFSWAHLFWCSRSCGKGWLTSVNLRATLRASVAVLVLLHCPVT